jgi:mannose-6-phosphate isomerase-like protein (cupin superfamily)
MTNRHVGPTQLIILGEDESGRSTVVHNGPVQSRADRPKGAFVEEIWRQETLPVTSKYDGTTITHIEKLPPPAGFSVRKFAMPGNSPKRNGDSASLEAEFGLDNLTPPLDGQPILHRHRALHVFTVLSGAMYFVLRTGDVLLREGDTVVLPGTMHDWYNPFDEPCVLFAVMAPLVIND